MEKLISTSRVTEVHSSSDLMTSAFKENDWSNDVHLTKIFTGLENKSKQIAAAIMYLKNKSVLDEFDDDRDYLVRALFYLLTGYTYYPDEEIQSAANLALSAFDGFGLSIVYESYPNESSLIVSMLGNFKKPKMQEALAILPGVGELTVSLGTAQDNFKQANLEWKKEQAVQDSVENASELKKELLDIINNQIHPYLYGMSLANKAVYGPLELALAKIISDNNEAVRRRRNNTNEE